MNSVFSYWATNLRKSSFKKPAAAYWVLSNTVSISEQFRLNPEHKSCFKWVFCFNLRSFSEHFTVHESVMCPLTLIMKLTFDGFCKHFLMSPIHSSVNNRDTKFGSNLFNSLAVIPINIFRYQNKS